MNKQILYFTLFGVGMVGLGYFIGCIKTRGEFMEAMARAMANQYSQ